MIRKRIILINSVLIVVLAVVFIAVTMFNKPHINVSEKAPNLSIEATKVLNDFQNNETEANAKYLEKIIQVTGVISEQSLTNEKGIITLNSDDSFGSVMCHLDIKENKKMGALKTGQTVIIKGICTGYLMDVILVKCVILN
ncbi:OB-fold protein [Aquimarina sp. 2304DJ70-9]|uniref:OB-fold protein n=1 Tax=Aquimarina penaris TaxID=3231044 RepID=UPI0034627056